MAEGRRRWFVPAVGAGALALAVWLMRASPLSPPDGLIWVERGTALLGYWALFAAIVSSADPAAATRITGVPFTRLHCVLSWVGLALLSAHPLAVALVVGRADVFVPCMDSWRAFLEDGGRVAWYLLLVAAATAQARRRWGSWRLLHLLTYAAFFLGTAHALYIGRTHHLIELRILSVAMACVVAAVPAWRRLPWRRRA